MGLFNDALTDRACWKCEHWGGDIPNTSHAFCLHRTRRQVQAYAERGCVFWVRAIGSDDEDPRRRG